MTRLRRSEIQIHLDFEALQPVDAGSLNDKVDQCRSSAYARSMAKASPKDVSLVERSNELSGKMLRDGEGRPVVREDFLMDGINCEPFEYPMAAMETNRLYGKNAAKGDVKSHHYVLSFDPRDADVGLTFEEAHRMALGFAHEWFGGHQEIVFTHPEGHNESGNIHCHIAFCSVRARDEPVREWMTRENEWRAGGKHHATDKCHAELKQAVMDMYRKRNLHQVELLGCGPPLRALVILSNNEEARRFFILCKFWLPN